MKKEEEISRELDVICIMIEGSDSLEGAGMEHALAWVVGKTGIRPSEALRELWDAEKTYKDRENM